MVKDDEKRGVLFYFKYDTPHPQGANVQQWAMANGQQKAHWATRSLPLQRLEVGLLQKIKRMCPETPSPSVLPSPPLSVRLATPPRTTVLRVRKWCVFCATPRCALLPSSHLLDICCRVRALHGLEVGRPVLYYFCLFCWQFFFSPKGPGIENRCGGHCPLPSYWRAYFFPRENEGMPHGPSHGSTAPCLNQSVVIAPAKQRRKFSNFFFRFLRAFFVGVLF